MERIQLNGVLFDVVVIVRIIAYFSGFRVNALEESSSTTILEETKVEKVAKLSIIKPFEIITLSIQF